MKNSETLNKITFKAQITCQATIKQGGSDRFNQSGLFPPHKTHRPHIVAPKDLIAMCRTSFLSQYTFTPQWHSVYQELAPHIITSLAALHLQPLCSKTVLLLLPFSQSLQQTNPHHRATAMPYGKFRHSLSTGTIPWVALRLFRRTVLRLVCVRKWQRKSLLEWGTVNLCLDGE